MNIALTRSIMCPSLPSSTTTTTTATPTMTTPTKTGARKAATPVSTMPTALRRTNTAPMGSFRRQSWEIGRTTDKLASLLTAAPKRMVTDYRACNTVSEKGRQFPPGGGGGQTEDHILPPLLFPATLPFGMIPTSNSNRTVSSVSVPVSDYKEMQSFHKPKDSVKDTLKTGQRSVSRLDSEALTETSTPMETLTRSEALEPKLERADNNIPTTMTKEGDCHPTNVEQQQQCQGHHRQQHRQRQHQGEYPEQQSSPPSLLEEQLKRICCCPYMSVPLGISETKMKAIEVKCPNSDRQTRIETKVVEKRDAQTRRTNVVVIISSKVYSTPHSELLAPSSSVSSSSSSHLSSNRRRSSHRQHNKKGISCYSLLTKAMKHKALLGKTPWGPQMAVYDGRCVLFHNLPGWMLEPDHVLDFYNALGSFADTARGIQNDLEPKGMKHQQNNCATKKDRRANTGSGPSSRRQRANSLWHPRQKEQNEEHQRQQQEHRGRQESEQNQSDAPH